VGDLINFKEEVKKRKARPPSIEELSTLRLNFEVGEDGSVLEYHGSLIEKDHRLSWETLFSSMLDSVISISERTDGDEMAFVLIQYKSGVARFRSGLEDVSEEQMSWVKNMLEKSKDLAEEALTDKTSELCDCGQQSEVSCHGSEYPQETDVSHSPKNTDQVLGTPSNNSELRSESLREETSSSIFLHSFLAFAFSSFFIAEA